MATHDVLVAERASAPPAILEGVTFHSQQAAEKALKGFLAWHNVPFRRTHDLVELAQQCEMVDANFSALLVSANFLRDFAVDPRYPGAKVEPDEVVAKDALDVARDVVAFVVMRLPSHVQP
jgi:HEPN domain-containing protein